MPSGITLDSLNCRLEGSYLILFLLPLGVSMVTRMHLELFDRFMGALDARSDATPGGAMAHLLSTYELADRPEQAQLRLQLAGRNSVNPRVRRVERRPHVVVVDDDQHPRRRYWSSM